MRTPRPSGAREIPWRTAVLVILPLAFLDAAASSGSFLLQTTGERSPWAVTPLVALITLADAAGSGLPLGCLPLARELRSRLGSLDSLSSLSG